METRTYRKRNKRTQTTGFFEVNKSRVERIFEPLARMGRIPTNHFIALYGSTHVQSILKDLYHETEKLPRESQLLIRPDEINRHIGDYIFHELGPGAYAPLVSYDVLKPEALPLIHNTKIGGSRRTAHDLHIPMCVASIEIAVKKTPGLRFMSHLEILLRPQCPQTTRDAERPLAIPVGDTTIEADALFGIQRGDEAFFFVVELDRGTETVNPTNDVKKSSWRRKVGLYDAVFKQQLYKSYWGIRNLRVLSLIPDITRENNIKRLITSYPTAYLFQTVAPYALFQTPPDPMTYLFEKEWRHVGGSTKLIPERKVIAIDTR